MRQTLLLLLFLLFLFPTRPGTSPLPQGDPPAREQKSEPPGNESSEEMLGYGFEQDVLYGRVYQKNLAPLSNREKIVWSFRIAEANPFL